MLVVRENVAINMSHVTCFYAMAYPRKLGMIYRIRFSFNHSRSDDNIENCVDYEFSDEQDMQNAFDELLNQAASLGLKVFYMDDKDLWPERFQEKV